MTEMTVEKIEKAHKELREDYLHLCEKYADKMPVYEFGYGMIEIAAQMIFYCAPNEEVARKTIQSGLDCGYEKSQELKR